MELYLITYTNDDGDNFDFVVAAADPQRAAYLYLEANPDAASYRPDQLLFRNDKQRPEMSVVFDHGFGKVFTLKPNGYEGVFIWDRSTEEFPKNHMLFVGSFAFEKVYA